MLLLNFAHPLTGEHRDQMERLGLGPVERIIDLPVHVDTQQPLWPQVTALVDGVGLSAVEWQTLPLIVNPPSLNYIAVTLLAELHGRCGYFPASLRLRPVGDSLPPRFEVAEVINLQAARDAARTRRYVWYRIDREHN